MNSAKGIGPWAAMARRMAPEAWALMCSAVRDVVLACRRGRGYGTMLPMLRVIRVLAPNPGPFTLEGTNTWIVGRGPCAVIDPGPEDEGHIRAVARAAGPVEAILVTHGHPDHAPGAAELARLTGASVFAMKPSDGGIRLKDNQAIDVGGARLRCVRTP